MKKAKKILSVISSLGLTACLYGGMMVNCNAEETSNAYVFLRSVSENVRYEGINSSINTVSDGAGTTIVNKDGSYNVSFDVSKESKIDSIDEISILKVYVCGVDVPSDVKIKVDSLKIDGGEVTLSEEPVCEKSESGTDIFVDLYDTNGTKLFNRTDYQNIKTISIDFTVSGWPEVTTTAETTTTDVQTSETVTTVKTETTASQTTDSVLPKTGVKSSAAFATVGMVALACLAISSKKKD